jgi:integrase
VSKELHCSWVFRFERNGRERWMGLGSFHDYTLDEAREAATEARKQLRKGIDPIDVAHEERARRARESAKLITFKECADAFYKQHGSKWTKKYGAAFHQRLNAHAFPVLGSQPVNAINKAIILKMLGPIWETKHATAMKVLGLVESILDFANFSDWRTGDNPAKWDGNLKHALPSLKNTQHHSALPFAEINSFIVKLRAFEGVAPRALEFTILCAVRSHEALLATWDEIDLATAR